MEVTYIKLFVDYLDAIEPLSNAERGKLFTALLEYAKSGEASHLSGNERFIFPMMKAQIDRDIAAMDEISEKRSQSGKMGGRPKKQEETKKANAFSESKKSKDKEEDKDKDKDKNNIKARMRADIITYLNKKLGTKYKADTNSTKKHIDARLNEGYTVEDFYTVIDKKCAEWKGTDFEQYLRPETLFGTKFESYLNAFAGKQAPSPPVYTHDDLFDELYADNE